MDVKPVVPEARFRIDSLAVERFKAFGVPQEIMLAKTHCFMFGANVRGKSSIVEAIRWGLIGSERDSDGLGSLAAKSKGVSG